MQESNAFPSFKKKDKTQEETELLLDLRNRTEEGEGATDPLHAYPKTQCHRLQVDQTSHLARAAANCKDL